MVSDVIKLVEFFNLARKRVAAVVDDGGRQSNTRVFHSMLEMMVLLAYRSGAKTSPGIYSTRGTIVNNFERKSF